MAIVTLDLLAGNAGKITGNNPTTPAIVNLTRMVLVEGLISSNGYDRIKEAVLELFTQTGIQIGSQHPSESAAILRTITPESLDTTVVHLKLEYKTDKAMIPVYQIGGSVESQQVNEDADGDAIEVWYDYPEDYPEQERAGKQEKTGVIISKFVPRTVLQIVRTEYFDLDGFTPITADQILQRAKNYMGKVNSVAWNVDTVAGVRSWLCTQIVGTTSDYSFSFKVTYTFVYNEDQWKQRVSFIDPNTGKPPPDIALLSGSAYQDVVVYKGADFNVFNL